MRVALYQMPVLTDVPANARRIVEAIERAAEARAEILLTPEGSLSGYTPHFEAAAVRDALGEVTRYAKEKGVGLALGVCFQEDDGKRYNQLRFYLPDGTYLGFHAKILRCGNLEGKAEGEHHDFAEKPLRTFAWRKDLTVGGLICNDMWANPHCTPMPDTHLTQQLSRLGARVIFHAVNGGRDGGAWSREVYWPYHEANLRIRARAGKVWIVTADNAHPEAIPCAAPSGVLDPQGEWRVRAEPQGAQCVIFDIPV